MTDETSKKRFRGVKWEGKRVVSVPLSESEHKALKKRADSNCRSLSGEVLWIVKRVLEEA